MKKLLLALALSVAPVAAQESVARAPKRAVPLPDPMPVTAPLLPPSGAVILYYADPRCPPSVPTAALPSKAARDCYALRVRLALVGILKRDKITPGKASPCYSYTDPGVYANCLDVAARTLPAQAYGLSGQWTKGLLYGEPWEGCAAGFAQKDYVFASLAEPARVLPLVAHEAANNWLQVTYDRLDLTDGPIVGEASNAAKAACGGTN